MFRLSSEAALRACFRPKDADIFEPSTTMTFPLLVRDYVAWTHPAGGRVYLVFALPGGTPTGLVFQSNGGPTAGVGQMCDWCHAWGAGSEVALLTTRLNASRRIGVHVCSDLSCRRKVEDEANRAGRSPLPALRQLVERIGQFASDGLRIDLFR